LGRCRTDFDALVTHERVLEALSYDPETGIFFWRERKAGRQRGPVGSVSNAGYLRIMIDGQSYLSHRLAWFYMTGEWPVEEVDHRDLNTLNNRWDNLREATRRDNIVNRAIRKRALPRGVYAHGARFVAKLSHDRQRVHIGVFDTPEQASAAFLAEALRLRGEFERG
jgi:hypothetical protein